MQVVVQASSLAAGESRRGTYQTALSDACCAEEAESETERNWGYGADGSTTSASHTGSSSAPKQAPVTSSLVFQYFSLLASYHGAGHVPRYWADMLRPSSVAGAKDDDASTSEHARECADELISPVTEIDLSVCYVGPTMLLALADLLRVQCVTVQRGRSQRWPVGGKEGMGTLPSVMAPLWGAGARRSSKGEEVMCSLLPHLTTLRLMHLAMDFTVPDDATGSKGGNAVLRSMLEALQGHPSLKMLDLSGNPVAAALVPAISRLVQVTPSLTTLMLDDTLVTDSEKEMLRAQCLLNELRLQRATADGAAATVSDDASSTTSPESVTRGLWAAQMCENVLMAVERGVSAVPWLLGKSTALIRRYGTSKTSEVETSAFGRSARTSRTSDMTGGLSQFGSSSVSPSSATDVAPSLEIAYLSYDYTSESSAAAVATVPPPAGATWSAECTEVARCAFMSRSLAQRTVLGGRPVWPNVPKPLEAVVSTDLAPPSAAAVAATDLLLTLRQQVLPEPEAPPGLRRGSARDDTFLTTAEEEYWSVRKKQEVQWGYVLQKVSENLTPVFVRNGHTLYAEGSVCDSIYLLPVSLQETRTYAELHVGVNPGQVNRVLPGQWVGEAEILDCLSIYAKYPSSATDGSAAVPGSETVLQRSSTVRVFTEATDDVVLWALPFRVAFFYLYAPYQLLHKQFVHRTPMSAFAHIHPVHLACAPVHMHASHGSCPASAGQGLDSGAAPVLCRYAFMSRHVLLLEEGEFLLRLPSLANHVGPRNGGRTAASTRVVMEDHHLLSGVTVLTQPLLDLDAALRVTVAAELAAENGGATVTYARGPHGTLALGKQAELCRFRAAKVERTAASATVSYSGASETAETVGDSDGNAAALRQCRTGGKAAQWRYSAITNEEFTALCPALRVALTRHICVVHDL
ncbi:hypothetical protein, unknown function [Leishmania infantum JPCM5]|uniref:Uncharacterized protein n=2 Tax=Leishmania infantum TaxID=5671 RepID=E9AHE0_LEIIN|nr:hypothetical protein, unknown function [Leishmania infantum JPCM5]CAC9499079.1 hypothetical_protein_-_conserved [Leishmania infantum]CBZ08817.1 hypothetical protein, unknown function [Leishmania infantum JPCM5]SUZ42951.1 hypothetical_protein_-_conserved [Leishmania infantum]|eukprot:XP_003392641.1 hypothetical protein, unknown function [Leishmania infantum JPCM5]